MQKVIIDFGQSVKKIHYLKTKRKKNTLSCLQNRFLPYNKDIGGVFMLLQVRFKNFKSFTQETVIDLRPSKSEILEETNTYQNILKGCCFYGSNASGKTNALIAMTFLLDLLFKDGVDTRIANTIFNNEPIMFLEYTFVIDDQNIVYYFEFDRNGRIQKEQLWLDKKEKINRLLNSAESFLPEKRVYEKDVMRNNLLLLRAIYFNTQFIQEPVLAHWFEFLKHSMYINPARNLPKVIVFSNEVSPRINLKDYIEKNGVEEINHFFKEFQFPYTLVYEKKNVYDSLLPYDSFINRLKIKRKDLPPVPYYMESLGNVVLLDILPVILSVTKTGGMLFIDEFSSGLHNKLEELLVKYIYKHSKNCQLFFVSHSTNLLKTSLLRPDQVYAVDIDARGSFIYRFSDAKPRESQNLEKMYLSGIFGGIPLYDSNND